MTQPAAKPNRRPRRRWALVAAGVVLLAAGAGIWWRLAGEARLGRFVAGQIAKATGLEVSIARARFQGRTVLRLFGAAARDANQWSATVKQATVQWKEPLGVHTLRTSGDSIRALSLTGVRIRVRETGRRMNWQQLLDGWRKQGRIKAAPVRVRDLQLVWQGNPNRRLNFHSLQLERLASGKLSLHAEGTVPAAPDAPFSGDISGNDDGTNVHASLRADKLNLSVWLPPAGAHTGAVAGTLSAACDALLVPAPRVTVAGAVSLHKFQPQLARWPKAVGAVSGRCRVKGAVVLTDTPRAAVNGSFVGLADGVPAAKVALYLQTAPAKMVLDGAVNDVSLPPLLALVKPEANQYVTAGRGRLAVKARYALSGGVKQFSAHGSGAFRNVAVTFQKRTYQPLTGAAAFGLTQTGDHLQPSEFSMQFQPSPGLFQQATVRVTPQPHNRLRARVTFTDLRLQPFMELLPPGTVPATVTGRATGEARVQVAPSGPVWSSLRGGGRVSAVTVRSNEWGDLTRGRAQVKLRGFRAFIRNGTGVWGASAFHAHGDVEWRPPATLNLAVRCDDLKLTDVQRFLKGKLQLPRVERPVLKADVRLKGPVSALRGEGVIECASLPVNQQTLGDAVTASFVILWKPSPVKSPRLQIARQKIRLNLTPGFEKAWEELLKQR